MAVAAVTVFWVVVFLAGWVNDGYAPTRDYISALASRGADHAWLGVGALVALSTAHLAVASIFRRGSRLVALFLAAAGLAGLVVASMRISCRAGAARCAVAGQVRPTDLMDSLHGKAVACYGVLVVLAMVASAARWWVQARALALVSAALAPVSAALLLASTAGAHPGAAQRLWLGVNTGWLVALALREGEP